MENFLKFTGGLILVLGLLFIVGALFAWPIVWIWNWMMPELFDLPLIGFWHAFWGSILFRLIFGTAAQMKSTSG